VKRLTLEEIGRLAGVSRSTVSRVVNDHPEVSADVKERVLEVIRDTGYRPNRAARSLVSSRSELLGLVIPSAVKNIFQDPYFGWLIQGATRAANAAEQTLSLFLFEDRREELELYSRVIANGLVDGVIVTATTTGDPLVARMRDDGTPFVTVGRPDDPDVPYVDVENRAGAREGTLHLVGHGRRRLATVAAPSNTTTGIDRRNGFLDAAAEAGISVPSDHVAEADFTEDGALEATRALLQRGPDGIFCASDTMARGALRAIEEAGLRCPEDVAVVSFDGIAEPHQTTPSLTTVAQPVRRTGEEAVGLLLEVLSGTADGVPTRILPTELVVRESCGCRSG
jgi:LacI family transcriptional regulator